MNSLPKLNPRDVTGKCRGDHERAFETWKGFSVRSDVSPLSIESEDFRNVSFAFNEEQRLLTHIEAYLQHGAGAKAIGSGSLAYLRFILTYERDLCKRKSDLAEQLTSGCDPIAAVVSSAANLYRCVLTIFRAEKALLEEGRLDGVLSRLVEARVAELEAFEADRRALINRQAKSCEVNTLGENIIEAAVTGDWVGLRGGLNTYLTTVIIRNDFSVRFLENHYSSNLASFLTGKSADFGVLREVQAGLGRADMVIYPQRDRGGGRRASVLELKRADSSQEAEAKAKEAVGQIYDMEYWKIPALFDVPVNRIFVFGVACYGQEAHVEPGNISLGDIRRPEQSLSLNEDKKCVDAVSSQAQQGNRCIHINDTE